MLRIILLPILFLLTIYPVRSLGGPITMDTPLEDYAIVEPADTPPDLSNRPLSRSLIEIREKIVDFKTWFEKPVVETQAPFPEGQAIIVNLANQELYRFEEGLIRETVPVSTGVSGHRTPAGNYAVYSKDRVAWSNKYECAMLNWLAITKTGTYGIHALEGTSYLRKLGRTASHGCVRVSHDDAGNLYQWAEIGTPVKIVPAFDPIPYFASPQVPEPLVISAPVESEVPAESEVPREHEIPVF